MRRKHTARPGGGSQASGIAASPAEGLSQTVQSLLAKAQALSTRLAALNEVAVAMQRSTDTRAMLQVMANQARWVDGRHLAWVCAPLVALGSSEGYVVTVRDVSAQVALEQLREDMTQMLIHDLRTPLATIIMGLDLHARACLREI